MAARGRAGRPTGPRPARRAGTPRRRRPARHAGRSCPQTPARPARTLEPPTHEADHGARTRLADAWPSLHLREPRRLRTRRTIQAQALRLFADKGFQATTIEEIAAAAEMAPRTFFRYFPTKEEVVFWAEFPPMLGG